MSGDSAAGIAAGPSQPDQRRAWNLILIALTGLIGAGVAAQPLAVNHDVALYLHCGRLITQGLRPYVDFVDLNPPMVMYFSAVPALISSLLGLHVIVCFHLLVIALTIYSALASRRVLDRAELRLQEHEIHLPALAVILLSLFLLNAPYSEWGQREHLFVLLYLPFFLLRWARWSGGAAEGWLAAAAGFGAGLGACLKPHFVVIALSLEAVQALRARRIQPWMHPEMATFVLAGAAYAVHFALLSTEVREAFFGRWLPMVAAGYSAYDREWSLVLIRPAVITALAGAVAGAWAWRSSKARTAELAGLFGLFALIAVVLYTLQHKGWWYQSIPAAFAGGAAMLSAAAARSTDRAGASGVRPPSLRLAAMVLAGAIVVGGLLTATKMQAGDGSQAERGLREIVDRLSRRGAAILMISTSVPKIYPLMLRVEREAASRYLWTFPLPMLYASDAGTEGKEFPYRPRGAMGAEESQFLDELGSDIAKNRPEMILIDKWEKPQGCPTGFVLPGYFKASGFIEREMTGYRYWNSVYGWDVYLPAEGPAVREKSKS